MWRRAWGADGFFGRVPANRGGTTGREGGSHDQDVSASIIGAAEWATDATGGPEEAYSHDRFTREPTRSKWDPGVPPRTRPIIPINYPSVLGKPRGPNYRYQPPY